MSGVMRVSQGSDTDRGDCPDVAQLVSFTRGTLDDASASTVSEHLASCDACTRLLESYFRESDTLVDGLRRANPTEEFQHEPEFQALLGLTEAIAAPRREVLEWFPYRLQGYHVVDRIAIGGMGTVHKAWDPSLGRFVALKRLLPHVVAAETVNRFRGEPWFGSRLQHPNVVQVFAVGWDEDRPYFTMEFLDGGTLDSRIREAPMPPSDAAKLIATVARALDHCHVSGVLHRDLKPSNILFTAAGFPKIADFGLAKSLESTEPITQSDAVLGTPHYMAPEQARGARDEVDVETDVHALGAILFRCIAGSPPYTGKNNLEVLQRVIRDPPPRLSQRCSVADPDIEAICTKCLAKDPGERYRSAGALADDLERYEHGVHTMALQDQRRCSRRSMLRKSAAVVVAGSLAVAAPLVLRRDPSAAWAAHAEDVLSNGGTLQLIGETGLPEWYRIAIASDETTWLSLGHDETATFGSDTSSACLLLDAVPVDRYRFECELRHDQSAVADSGVGLVMTYCEAAVENTRVLHCCCTLKYSDQRDEEAIARSYQERLQQFRLNIPAGNMLDLSPYLAETSDGRLTPTETRTISAGDSLRFTPHLDLRSWRRIILDVEPERLRVTWEPETDGREMSLSLTSARRGFLDVIPVIPQVINSTVAIMSPRIESMHRGGLGVYVYNGKLSIRNASLSAT